MGKQKQLYLIQVLRGIASLLVVLFHITTILDQYTEKTYLYNIFYFGYSGVDIFFVLSGFIITYTSINSINSQKNIISFYKKRFIRIFPIYWLFFIFFLLLQIIFPSYYATPFKLNFSNVFSSILLFPKHIMINGVSWTLTYELFFYILFSTIFLFPNKKVFFRIIFVSILVLFLQNLFNLKLATNNSWLNLLLSPMNIEFFLGVLVALFYKKISKQTSKFIIFVGIALLFIAAFFITNGIRLYNYNFNRVIYFGFPAFLIVLGAVSLERKTHGIKIPILFLSLGDASYSLYLFHLPIVVASIKIASKFPHIMNNYLFLNMFILILIFIVCFMSILIFKYIEKPIIKQFNSIFLK